MKSIFTYKQEKKKKKTRLKHPGSSCKDIVGPFKWINRLPPKIHEIRPNISLFIKGLKV